MRSIPWPPSAGGPRRRPRANGGATGSPRARSARLFGERHQPGFLYTCRHVQRPRLLAESSLIVNAPSSSTTSTVRKASFFYFVFVMFSYTTGGPFGLEAMVTTSGPGMTLLYHLLIPLFWCIPVSLVSAELTTAMPVEGGFYRWSRAAFGDFWGFLAGWWNWSASFLLGGSYAVLFTDYLSFYFPQIVGWKHWLVSFALIACLTWVNICGIQMVGKASTIFELLIFLPVIAMVVLGLAQWHHNPFVPLVPPHQPF